MRILFLLGKYFEAARNLVCCRAQQRGELANVPLGHPHHRSGNTDAADHFAIMMQNRRGDAASASYRLFIVERVAATMDLV